MEISKQIERKKKHFVEIHKNKIVKLMSTVRLYE